MPRVLPARQGDCTNDGDNTQDQPRGADGEGKKAGAAGQVDVPFIRWSGRQEVFRSRRCQSAQQVDQQKESQQGCCQQNEQPPTVPESAEQFSHPDGILILVAPHCTSQQFEIRHLLPKKGPGRSGHYRAILMPLKLSDLVSLIITP